MRWHRPTLQRPVREEVFADVQGLQVVQVRAHALVVRLPDALPEYDEDLNRLPEVEPPLVEVADLHRATERLRSFGFDVGAIEEDGWEGIAALDIPGIGSFRLVGPWLPGWADELRKRERR